MYKKEGIFTQGVGIYVVVIDIESYYCAFMSVVWFTLVNDVLPDFSS